MTNRTISVTTATETSLPQPTEQVCYSAAECGKLTLANGAGQANEEKSANKAQQQGAWQIATPLAAQAYRDYD